MQPQRRPFHRCHLDASSPAAAAAGMSSTDPQTLRETARDAHEMAATGRLETDAADNLSCQASMAARIGARKARRARQLRVCTREHMRVTRSR
jgi:hypothetical protein